MQIMQIGSFLLQRIWVLVSLCIVGLTGFWLWRYYDGPAKAWFNYYVSGTAYVVFWSLVAFFFWPQRRKITKIAVIVFVVTCALEFLQLYKPPFLQQVRSTLLGAAILGTCFVWRQFPYYAVGSLIGWLWLRLLCKKTKS